MIAPIVPARRKGTDTVKSISSTGIQMDLLENTKTRTILNSDPSAPPDFHKFNLQQQKQLQQQGSRFRSEETSYSSRVERDPMREGTWVNLGGVTTSGITGQRGTKTHGANLCRSSVLFLQGSATKDCNLPVTDGKNKHYTYHNGTLPA